MPNKETVFEKSSNLELFGSLTSKPAPIHLHLYQPPRLLTLSLNNQTQTVFDISGNSGSFPGYNHQITHESYRPLVEKGVLANEKISWNLYGVTSDWLEFNYPKLIDSMRDQIEKSGKPPVGDTYLHIIYPFLSTDHKDMLLQISKRVYHEKWGVDMDTIWLPESAVDSDTLSILVKNNIHAVHLREHQTTGQKHNNVMAIKTPHGKILAISGNNYLSGKIGFDKPWSDCFFEDWHNHSQRLGFSPRISIDGETLGHWWKADNGSFEFTTHLLRHLHNGYNGHKIYFDPEDIPDTNLIENTSWSCLDTGLGRWKGDNGCRCALPSNEYQANQIRRLKKDLFDKMSLAGSRIDEALESTLPGWRTIYIEWFLNQRQKLARNLPVSAEFLKDKRLESLFLSAYCRDLGWTSCGWFFGDIEGYERRIPANSLKAISAIMNWPDILPI